MPDDDPVQPQFPATYAESRASMQAAREELWAAEHQLSEIVLSQYPLDEPEQRLKTAITRYAGCLVDCAVSGLEEFAKAAAEYADGAKKTQAAVDASTKLVGRTNIALVILTALYVAAAAWQAFHPAISTINVLPSMPVVVTMPRLAHQAADHGSP